MKIMAKKLVKTYNELNKTLYIMQKDKGVTPLIFSKVLDTRQNIHEIILDSVDGLNSDEMKKILNKIKRS